VDSGVSHYRDVSRKILEDFPAVFQEVSGQLLRHRDRVRFSMESRVDDPQATMRSFNQQFQLREPEQEVAAWGWMWEPGHTMFHIVNAYTPGAMFTGLPATSSYNLQIVGGQVLALVR
jgi:hypothetical protein